MTELPRSASGALGFVALLARRNLRAQWQEEWLAELSAAYLGFHGGGAAWFFTRRLAAALVDALCTHTLPRGYRRPPLPPPQAGRIDKLLQDLRHAVRSLLKAPAYSLLASLTLALGIGATAAIFSVVWGVVLAPLPFPDADRLVAVWGYHEQIGRESASAPDFADWRTQATSFEALAAMDRRNYTLTGDGDPVRLRGAQVTFDFFDVYGLLPAAGRLPHAVDDRGDAPRSVVLGHRAWRDRFGGDPNVIGRSLKLDGEAYEVVGIAPPGFDEPAAVELWSPMHIDAVQANRREDYLRVVGRLREGVGVSAAQQEMAAIMARLAEEYPQTNVGWSAEVVPLHEQVVGEVRPALLTLFGAVGFVLLIACANVANLTLVRSGKRRGELALRAALGASAGRLARLVVVESLLVAAVGGVAGLGLAALGVRGLVGFAPAGLPRLDNVGLNATVLLFVVGTTALTGLAFGLVPGIRVAGAAVKKLVRGTRSGGDRAGNRIGSALVLGQTALVIVLLAGAGLMMRSLENLRRIDLGFQQNGLAMGWVVLPAAKFPEDAQKTAFWDQLLERVQAAPGVQSAAGSDGPPLGGAGFESFTIEGRPPVGDAEVQDAHRISASDSLFATLGIPLLRGRNFDSTDRPAGVRVAILDTTLADRYFGQSDPLGARIDFGGGPLTIVGVVGAVRQTAPAEEPYPTVYVPLHLNPGRAMAVLVRGTGDPAPLLGTLRGILKDIDADLPLTSASTFDQLIANELGSSLFLLWLLGLFAACALVLAIVGLYGVLSLAVTQRLREMAVRLAIGARGRDLVASLVWRTLLLVGSGAALGVVAAVLLGRSLRSLWYRVEPSDPVALGGVVVVLFVAALIALVAPARRIFRLDPVKLLGGD